MVKETMVTCPNCGKEIIDEGNFCQHCGWVKPGIKVRRHKKREDISGIDWLLLCCCTTPIGALIYYIFFAYE